MKISAIIFFLLLSSPVAGAQIDSVLISNATFNEAKFNNPHAGSGFLLAYKDKIFACTAKHVLFFAKTDNMKTISFGDELKQWKFTSKLNENTSVIAGKLINENSNETLEMPPKGDWLIFEVKGTIPENVAVYNLREKPLTEGESVHFLGYPYNSNVPVRISGKFLSKTADCNLSLEVPKGNYGGCSGGPVLDSKNRLVGLVSMGYFNENENKMIFEPASLDYLMEVIKNLNK